MDSAAPDASALCVGCGFCCNGTLFSRTRVSADEQVSMAKLGFSFSEVDGYTVFEQPCPKESCGGCTIYEARPEICRGFRCGLLQSYQSGALSLEEAKEKQDQARDLIEAVAADEPTAARNGPRHRLRMSLAAQMKDGDSETRRSLGRQFLNVVALDAFLERWFRNKEKVSESRIP